MARARAPARRTGSLPPAQKAPENANEEWWRWFRIEFLRSCFVGGSLAWDGFGAIQIRYTLDPWRPGQESSPAYVYGLMVVFLILSTIAQSFLYRRWWPSEERAGPRRVVSLASVAAAARRGIGRLLRVFRRTPAGDSKPPESP